MNPPPEPPDLIPTVLVVDDTPATLRLLTEHLLAQGFKVVVALDGEEAVRRVLLVRPSLVIMDVMMPGLDGFATTRRIQESPETRDIPIILMTSLHDTESKVKGFAAGAVDFVTKPLQLDEVSARIRTHISLRELRMRLLEKNALLHTEVAERQRAEEALKEANEQLEGRVQERTGQLLETNARLLSEIQERQKAQGQLIQAQKMEAFGQLAGGIAHDFNNILTVIIGQAQCLEFSEKTVADYEGAMKEIQEAADRAKNLTRQLLVFSRRQGMVRTPMDVVKVIGNLSKMLRRLIGEDIELQIHAAQSGLSIDGDASMIEQVLVNLSVNARDAMPHGGTLSIEVGEEYQAGGSNDRNGLPSGEYVVVKVRDTGVGMPAAIAAHIFEPFFTTKPAGVGTGLGLAISSSIVQQHGGFIEASSTEGKGTEFRIWLPKHSGVRNAAGGSLRAGAPLRGHDLVLLVEDEDVVRRSTRQMLARFGYRILEAGNGDEALSLWRENSGRIDMLISDIVMPGSFNGRSLAARLRQEKPALKVLLVSGYDPGVIDRKAPELSETPFPMLSKPFSLEALIAAVAAQFGRA